MQLFSRNKALAALSLGALAALGACGDDVTVPAPVNPPVAVTISPSNANVNVGSFVDLAVAITGGTTTPTLATCSTSNAAVATAAVQGGNACRVTGVSTGAVSITAATSAGQTAGASVTVNAPVPAISGIAISPAAQNLQVGGTFTITANPTTQAPGATIARNFVSSNAAVATVNATTGVVTAVAPGQTTITVTLTGTGTGLTAANVTGQVAVTVTALPPSVTAVTATPSSATLIVAGTQQITATGTYATGITGTITYGTSNPGVATVSGTGLITAVGPGQATITVTASSAGNASFAAASATQQIPVTVNAPAQVSIANITSGTTNDPVNISNVNGQIQVALNLLTNNNVVRSVKLFICPVGGTCPTAPAAEQTFGTAGAASGSINMFINTADFTVASDWSNASVKYNNGQQNLVAQIEVATSSQANNNLAILNFNNSDTWAARHVAPTRSALSVTNVTFFGGPGAEGRGSVTIVPVLYTAGRSIVSVNAGMTNHCSNSATFTATTPRPWTYTYGATTTAAGDVDCGGQSSATPSTAPDFGAVIISSIDNAQTAGPDGDDFATTTSSTPAVGAPAIIRADYQAPNGGSLPLTGNNRWINAAYTFSLASLTDNNGVGLKSTRDTRYEFKQSTAADKCSAPVDWTALPGGNKFTAVASESECADVFTNNVYTARAQENDRLENVSTTSLSGGPFGVDVTAPAISFVAANSDVDKAVVDAAADLTWQVEFLDSRSGFTSQPQSHSLVQANAAISGLFPDVVDGRAKCVVGSSTSTNSLFTATILSAPNCAPTLYAGTLVAGSLLNHQANAPVAATQIARVGDFGYFRYSTFVVDQAGNASATLTRTALATGTQSPVVTGLTVGTNITNTPFRPTVDDSVEVTSASMVLGYNFTGAAEERDSLVYPRRAFSAITGGLLALDHAFTGTTVASSPFLFDDVLFWRRTFDIHPLEYLPSTFTGAQRTFTSVIERVGAAGEVVSATPVKAELITARVWNARAATAAGLRQAGILSSATPNVAYANYAAKNADSAAVRVDTFTVLGTFNAVGSAPAALPIGLKAQAISPISATQPPFARVDFYQLTGVAGEYRYIGSATNAVTGAVGGTTLTQNSNNRFWTYTINSKVYGWDQTLGGAASAIDAGTYIAIGVNAQGMGLQTLGTAVTGTAPSPFRR